ncbi:YicC/YloC family endoribonuclease [Lentimonas sp. CC10]|uniref:YicC/YloC family endoribonuclease n=2 Tax=Lentimonas TaxID=417293 RepID=UPI001A7ED9EF|nr:YicC/YloC family endoribonuclease [Lentimonas sp. CC10]
MRSMTGYGRGSADAPEHNVRIEVEITSVNRKTLDAQVSCPREWNGLDQQCNAWLKGAFQRGRVNIQIKVESTEGAQTGLSWSAKKMDASLQQLESYAESRSLPFVVDSHLLLELAKTQKDDGGLPDWRELEPSIKTAFDQALVDIDAMRLNEGNALAQDLKERMQELDTIRQQIASNAENTVASYRDALMARLAQLKLELDINDERVLKEVAIFADRSDISEELTRLNSHFEQFKEFIDAKEATGRKMDFLCQEIHREFNTTGSKSSPIEITRSVIEGKNALERIREQVQNVE